MKGEIADKGKRVVKMATFEPAFSKLYENRGIAQSIWKQLPVVIILLADKNPYHGVKIGQSNYFCEV